MRVGFWSPQIKHAHRHAYENDFIETARSSSSRARMLMTIVRWSSTRKPGCLKPVRPSTPSPVAASREVAYSVTATSMDEMPSVQMKWPDCRSIRDRTLSDQRAIDSRVSTSPRRRSPLGNTGPHRRTCRNLVYIESGGSYREHKSSFYGDAGRAVASLSGRSWLTMGRPHMRIP